MAVTSSAEVEREAQVEQALQVQEALVGLAGALAVEGLDQEVQLGEVLGAPAELVAQVGLAEVEIEVAFQQVEVLALREGNRGIV